jgi:hypothetical protein
MEMAVVKVLIRIATYTINLPGCASAAILGSALIKSMV